jgi:hypothetical protein
LQVLAFYQAHPEAVTGRLEGVTARSGAVARLGS